MTDNAIRNTPTRPRVCETYPRCQNPTLRTDGSSTPASPTTRSWTATASPSHFADHDHGVMVPTVIATLLETPARDERHVRLTLLPATEAFAEVELLMPEVRRLRHHLTWTLYADGLTPIDQEHHEEQIRLLRDRVATSSRKSAP